MSQTRRAPKILLDVSGPLLVPTRTRRSHVLYSGMRNVTALVTSITDEDPLLVQAWT
jgi:hypothetical protein